MDYRIDDDSEPVDQCDQCLTHTHRLYPYMLPGHTYSMHLCADCTDRSLEEDQDYDEAIEGCEPFTCPHCDGAL